MDARPVPPSRRAPPGRIGPGLPGMVHPARWQCMRPVWLAVLACLLALGLLPAAAWAAAPVSARLTSSAPSSAPSFAPASPPPTANTPRLDAAIDEQARILRKAGASVVGVRALAAPEARSIETLGRLRLGSGVVIGRDGLVLTIGYLILEADKVDLITTTGRVLPARVVAYDLATGFGLLQPLVPLGIEPSVLGASAGVDLGQPHVIASGGDEAELSIAQVVSRRAFSGYWEYHIEDALFTVPPRTDHSGAALFNARGELLGIGSLIVMDAAGSGQSQPGNMFVPVDLLKPVLAEMREHGSSRRSARAWLGVNCQERSGVVRIIRITADSPAEEAGLRAGDLILKVDGAPVTSLEGLYRRIWENGAPERDIELEIDRGQERQRLKVRSIDRMKHLRGSTGI